MAQARDVLRRVLGKLRAIHESTYPHLFERRHLSKVSKESLLFHYGNIHSQVGQDGILAEIFRRVGIAYGTFVEFGAWDGVYMSNSRWLFEKGWNGVFIEADFGRFKRLEANYAGTEVHCANAIVGTKAGSRLADLLPVDPNTVTFVSIDVDGIDLEIFENLGFKPPVVLMEGGFHFGPEVTQRIPVEEAARNLQQPISVICKSAETLNYVPVCFYQDVYLVREDLAAPFRRMSAAELYADAFHFMPVDLRERLSQTRSNSSVVRRVEQSELGRFDPVPIK